MKARRWVLFFGLNVVISIVTTLVVLWLREELGPVSVVTPTPGTLVLGSAPTATPRAPTEQRPEPVVEAIQSTQSAETTAFVQALDGLGHELCLCGTQSTKGLVQHKQFRFCGNSPCHFQPFEITL